VFELQDKVGRDPQELADVKDRFMQAMAQKNEITGIYSGFSTSIPQIKLKRRLSGLADLPRWPAGERL
jgi:hypothetical protein